MMPFKKFCTTYCGMYHEETKKILGVFKEMQESIENSIDGEEVNGGLDK
jgi:hypothetical protein